MAREMPLPMSLACILPTDMAPLTAKMVRSYRLQLSLAQLAPNKFHFDSEYSQAMGYLKAMDDETFYKNALPYLKDAIHKDLDLRKIAAMVKSRIEIYPDINEIVDFFNELPDYDTAM